MDSYTLASGPTISKEPGNQIGEVVIDKELRGLIAGIMLLTVIGYEFQQNPDKIIDECAQILQAFINKNYVRLN